MGSCSCKGNLLIGRCWGASCDGLIVQEEEQVSLRVIERWKLWKNLNKRKGVWGIRVMKGSACLIDDGEAKFGGKSNTAIQKINYLNPETIRLGNRSRVTSYPSITVSMDISIALLLFRCRTIISHLSNISSKLCPTTRSLYSLITIINFFFVLKHKYTKITFSPSILPFKPLPFRDPLWTNHQWKPY